MKLNDNASVEKIRKKALEKVAHKINAYFIKNNIITTKLYATQTLSSGNVAIRITSIKETNKLREKDVWTNVLKSKTKLTQKQYEVVGLEIYKAIINFEKIGKAKEKLVTQNASICTGIKIESLF